MAWDRHHSSWWSDTNMGIKNWIAVLLIVIMAAISGVLVAMLMQRPNLGASVGEYTAKPVPMPTSSPRPVTLFIGDSYSAGAGASAEAKRWTTLSSKDLGWSEVNAALGGTGYLATAGKDGCGLDYCGTYLEAIAGVEKAEPDVIVISGGRNDNARLTQEVVEETIRSATARWPEARVVVTSPLWDDDEPPVWLSDSVDRVRDAAAATGVTFLDLGQPLADRGDYLSDDGVHPDDAGYAAIANAFVGAWRAAFPA